MAARSKTKITTHQLADAGWDWRLAVQEYGGHLVPGTVDKRASHCISVLLIPPPHLGAQPVVGLAYCSVGDTFKYERGLQIAFGRALKQYAWAGIDVLAPDTSTKPSIQSWEFPNSAFPGPAESVKTAQIKLATVIGDAVAAFAQHLDELFAENEKRA